MISQSVPATHLPLCPGAWLPDPADVMEIASTLLSGAPAGGNDAPAPIAMATPPRNSDEAADEDDDEDEDDERDDEDEAEDQENDEGEDDDDSDEDDDDEDEEDDEDDEDEDDK